MKKLIQIICVMAAMMINTSLAAGEPQFNNGGLLSFGVRTTLSMFSDDTRNYAGMSTGGNVRFLINPRLNIEGFGDYITTDITGLAMRQDAHGGFSVIPYLLPRTETMRMIEPFPFAGFCIDYSKFTKSGDTPSAPDDPNLLERYSFASQFGIGTHIRLNNRLDFTIVTHYMFHIGNDIHIHNHDTHIQFVEQSGGSLEGHLLFTLSANVIVADLW